MKLVIILAVVVVVFYYFKKLGSSKHKSLKAVKGAMRQLSPAVCPYCNCALTDRPRRNKKCPVCQSKIMLREGKLLTKEQAQEYDEKKHQRIARYIATSQMESLRRYQKSGVVKYAEILAASENSCEACRCLNGKRLSVESELRNPTLPVKNCTSVYGHCRCCYLPVVD